MSTQAQRVPRFGTTALATRANVVTVVRLVCTVPVLVLIARRGSSWLTVALWFALSCTDGLDGWLARRDGTTRSGAFLDPLADKFLAVGGFCALAARGDVSWLPVALVAGRELGVSVFRTLAGRRGVSMPARPLGKWKTMLQLLAVGSVLLPWTAGATRLQDAVVWAAVVLTLVSGADLVVRARRSAGAV